MGNKSFDKVEKNLKERGYQVRCFDTAQEAARYLDEQIDGRTVGIGGSVTMDQIGIYPMLEKHNTVYWHLRMPQGMTDAEVRAKENAAEIYLSSVNGLAETGEMINIDGRCNRVASIFYGHEKVYLVIGENKLEKDYDSALYRARNVAAPRNARRVGANTPCAVNMDRCYDCSSPDRICRGLSVLWGKPIGSEFEILLIHEGLGY